MQRQSLLILGGTAEAFALSQALVQNPYIAPVLSLAGRTRFPRLPPIPYRIGGFGGPHGLKKFLREQRTDLLIDATHPFAVRISENAVEAVAATGIPSLAIRRPAWEPQMGDRWTVVATVGEAAEATGATPQNVFLTIGRQELAPFKLYRHKYVIRSVERPDAAELPQGAKIITARGPFAEPDERALLMQHRIDCVVTKNSGGVTSAKIEAARALSLPVIIVARPEKPAMQAVTTVPDALAWLHEKVFDGSGLIETVRGV